MTGKANERQVGGNHYRARSLEHWDIVAMFGLDYFQGNVSKYLFRWRDKGGVQDLEKARHYLDKYIEIETARAEGRLDIDMLTDALNKIMIGDGPDLEDGSEADGFASGFEVRQGRDDDIVDILRKGSAIPDEPREGPDYDKAGTGPAGY